MCGSNVTGHGGLRAAEACCECGGGVYPSGGYPNPMQGLDGVYLSPQGSATSSLFSCVNGSAPRAAGGQQGVASPLSGPGTYWNLSLTVSAEDFGTRIRCGETPLILMSGMLSG